MEGRPRNTLFLFDHSRPCTHPTQRAQEGSEKMPVREVTGRPLSVREGATRQSVLGPGNAVQIHVTVLPLSRV